MSRPLFTRREIVAPFRRSWTIFNEPEIGSTRIRRRWARTIQSIVREVEDRSGSIFLPVFAAHNGTRQEIGSTCLVTQFRGSFCFCTKSRLSLFHGVRLSILLLFFSPFWTPERKNRPSRSIETINDYNAISRPTYLSQHSFVFDTRREYNSSSSPRKVVIHSKFPFDTPFLIGPENTWLRVPEEPLSGWRRGRKERHGKWNARIHLASVYFSRFSFAFPRRLFLSFHSHRPFSLRRFLCPSSSFLSSSTSFLFSFETKARGIGAWKSQIALGALILQNWKQIFWKKSSRLRAVKRHRNVLPCFHQFFTLSLPVFLSFLFPFPAMAPSLTR